MGYRSSLGRWRGEWRVPTLGVGSRGDGEKEAVSGSVKSARLGVEKQGWIEAED